jgi:hypothetical protein
MRDSIRKKGYFARHAKSSAALVSVGIHALLLVIAVSFVAVKVIRKEDAVFETKPVSLPKMKLKKLQVPVDMRKRKPKPKLRRRIVAKPKMNQSMPDIRMPEISGIKGGIGNSGGSGLGGGGVGFSMPEIKLFGIKSRGEKIFIVLDAADKMMYDEVGGIPAYTLIKQELVRILDGLPATALFNISVHDKWNTYVLFPKMVPASATHVDQVSEWLEPLNAVRAGMGAEEWGPRTLGPGGSSNSEGLRTGTLTKLRVMESWHRPVMLAMKQQADTVFVLTAGWGFHRYALGERDNTWYESSDGRRFLESYQKAVRLLDEDNRKRSERGEPPRAIARTDKRLMVETYVPGTPIPPEPGYYYITPQEFIESMLAVREQYKPDQAPARSGMAGRKNKGGCTFNVIHFNRSDGSSDSKTRDRFGRMVSHFRGDFRQLAGLKAIQSQVSADAAGPDNRL